MIFNIIDKLKDEFEKAYKQTRKNIISLYISDLLNVLNLIIKKKGE